jgi:hypothetical protein
MILLLRVTWRYVWLPRDADRRGSRETGIAWNALQIMDVWLPWLPLNVLDCRERSHPSLRLATGRVWRRHSDGDLSPHQVGVAGSPQGLLPGAPTDPGVRVKDAPGSSRCGVAVPHTSRSLRGNTLMRHGVLGVVPTPRPQRGTPFAPRGPEGRSPASMLLWGTATPCRPSRRTSFPSLGDTTLVPLVRPQRPRTRGRGSTWSWLPVAPSGQCRGNGKVSQVPVEPF